MRAHCNYCGGHKNHLILHQVRDADDSGEQFWYSSLFSLIKCAGCDAIHLRQDSTFSGNVDQYGNQIVNTVYYPPASSRRKPEWMTNFAEHFDFLQSDIGKILNEVYIALQNGSLRLSVMGIRSVLELIMIEKNGGDTGTISGNVDRFFQSGYVSAQQQPLFKDVVFEAGNAAMHRGYNPTEIHVSAILDMTEALIAAIYFHPAKAQAVSGAIPARRPRLTE